MDIEQVRAQARDTADTARLGIMAEVFDVIVDREPDDDHMVTLAGLTPEQVTSLYFDHIGPAIDRVQDTIENGEI